jgi:hypothetical protein
MSEVKKCPKCQEDIKSEAKKCKHCGADLRNWFVRHKILTAILVLIVLSIMTSAMSGENSTTNVTDNSISKEIIKNLTPKEKVETVISDKLSGKNNLSKTKLIKVNVVNQIDGGLGAFIEFNADDNLTTNLRKMGIESDMSEIYQILYDGDLNVTAASISAYFPLADKYGNETSEVVYKSILDKTEADKINWSADSATLKLEIVPSIWTTSILHPEFQ